MKDKRKLYLRLNLMSLFFVVVSFISVTLAWFVYSGISRVDTKVNVKAWYIEVEGEKDENGLVINVDEIYPGMETIEEEIKIKNFGDSDAQVKYEVSSARILNDHHELSETKTTEEIEDILAHNYPFHINIDLSKSFVLAQTDEATFKVSVSWPLDSGQDEIDSKWGTDAYSFKLNNGDQPSIRLNINLVAEQYVSSDNSADIKYRLGNEILYDVSLDKMCETEGGSCIRTNVIDVNNTIIDATVTLLPKLTNNYPLSQFNNSIEESINLFKKENSWNVETRMLNVEDVLRIISKDISTSVLVRENISDLVIGNITYGERINEIIKLATDSNGYFKFLDKFIYLKTDGCYWLNKEYNLNNAFAVTKLDEDSYKVYGELKNSYCNIIPVIKGKK